MSLDITLPIAFVEALSSAKTNEEILKACGEWLPNVLGADRGSLTVLEDDRFVFRTFSDTDIVAGQHIEVSGSLSGLVCDTRQAILLNAPDAQGSLVIEKLFSKGYRTSLIVPIIAGEKALGTLNLSSHTPNCYGLDDILRCEAVARWVGSQLLIRQYADNMQRLALTDPMTGLPNRRAFMSAAENLMARFGQAGEEFSAILFDIDHFKEVNDRFGHEAGDEVLAGVANIVRGRLPDPSVFGRIGGEEFGIVLPRYPLEAAILTADACREAICALSFDFGEQRTAVSASFGCTVVRGEDRGIDDVLRRADRALYDAKRGGRNRVRQAA